MSFFFSAYWIILINSWFKFSQILSKSCFFCITSLISIFKTVNCWLRSSCVALISCCLRSNSYCWRAALTDLINLFVISIAEGSRLLFWIHLLIYYQLARNHSFLIHVKLEYSFIHIGSLFIHFLCFRARDSEPRSVSWETVILLAFWMRVHKWKSDLI